MENKDIEKLLKESADEVQMKDFSERWEKLKVRIDSAQRVALEETTSETVLATSANSNLSQNSIKTKIIISVCAVFLIIAICLAIVLPITLKKDGAPISNGETKYLYFDDLDYVMVSENEFYSKLEETDLKIFNTENFILDNYFLLYTEESVLVGGKLELFDEVDGVYSEVVFYDTSVKSSLEIINDYKTCNINGVNIIYKYEPTEDYYIVKAVNDNTSYELKCTAADENVESFFEKLFG